MKEDQRIVITKRLLREGLLRLLEHKDINSIGVSELCKESGINRATFYRHYQQPRDVVAQIRYDMFRDINLMAEKNRAVVEPTKWLEDMCRYFHDSAPLLRVLFHTRTDEEFVGMINEAYHRQLAMLRGARCTEGMDDSERKLSAYYFAGGIYYLLRQWIMEPIDKSPEEVAAIIRRFLRTEAAV